MLAVMEIPGCLVALYLVSRLRHQGMDPLGQHARRAGLRPERHGPSVERSSDGHGDGRHTAVEDEKKMSMEMTRARRQRQRQRPAEGGRLRARNCSTKSSSTPASTCSSAGSSSASSAACKGQEVTRADDNFFVDLFQGILCLFLLEMGMTASRKLKDLKTAGWGYIAFGIARPEPLRHASGSCVAHVYSLLTAHALRAGDLRPVRRALRRGVVHRGPGGAAAGDPRGEPDASAGRLARPDVLLQRDDRHPGLHRDRQDDPEEVPGLKRHLRPLASGPIAKRAAARRSRPVSGHHAPGGEGMMSGAGSGSPGRLSCAPVIFPTQRSP